MKCTLALILFCCACGSGSPTHVTTSGGATAFTGVEAFSVLVQATVLSSAGDPSYPLSEVVILVASTRGACARVEAKAIKATSTSVQLSVSHDTADAIPVGTYPIGVLSRGNPTPTASVTAISVDNSCQVSTQPTQARSGTVTLSQISPGEVSGSVDVTLEDGTKLVGAFRAPHCTAAETPPALSDPPWACVQ